MYDAATVLLREYWRATGWNDQSSYLNLSKASDTLLDFPVPHGVALSSAAIVPHASFTANIDIMTVPLSGTLAYSHSNTHAPFDLDCVRDPLRRMTRAALFLEPDAYVPPRPFDANRPREMLMYGGMHFPSTCVEALCVLRLSEHWQLMTTAYSRAPRYPLVPLGRLFGLIPPKRPGQVHTPPNMSIGPPGTTNLLLTLQHQLPRTTAEYTYSLDDALWGARVLHQVHEFARGGTLSAGFELFISVAEKSGGVSSGLRCSLPYGAAHLFGGPKSAPAVGSLMLNPMMGYARAAYAARIDDDLIVCTRYDLNAFSYHSDWTLGFEYILHRPPEDDLQNELPTSMRERVGVWVHPNTTTGTSLRDQDMPASPAVMSRIEAAPQSEPQMPLMSESDNNFCGKPPLLTKSDAPPPPPLPWFLGQIKARLSTSGILSLLWEGHWRRCLVSVGLQSHFLSQAVSHLGVEIKYLSDT